MSRRPRRSTALALPFAAALACAHPRDATSPRAPCATLDPAACLRARALVAAAGAFTDERHDYLLKTVPAGAGVEQTPEGWRVSTTVCARATASAPSLDPKAVEYAFVGVLVDGTLVSADADLSTLLGRDEPVSHEVRLAALAFVRDASPARFDPTPALDNAASGATCSCGSATHYAGVTKYGALLSYDLRAPRDAAHVRALDYVRAALGDARFQVRESRVGTLALAGVEEVLADARAQLRFSVGRAAPVATEATALRDLCDFATPDVSPSPLDFGVAPYGTQATRSVHVTNRSNVELEAILGASTFLLPARGTVDLPLRWTPTGDAPGCETQTRDESIPFLRASRDPARAASAPRPRTARVLETIRTGRPTVSRAERVEPGRKPEDSVRDWTCPPDFVRTACRASAGAIAEARGEAGCHFACPARAAGTCRYDASIECALHCPR